MFAIEIILCTESKNDELSIKFRPEPCLDEKECFDYIKKEAYKFFKSMYDSKDFEFGVKKGLYMLLLERLNYHTFTDECHKISINEQIPLINKLLDDHAVYEDVIQEFEYKCIFFS
jgi:hypothetical protein